jgi:hypothetical protein
VHVRVKLLVSPTATKGHRELTEQLMNGVGGPDSPVKYDEKLGQYSIEILGDAAATLLTDLWKYQAWNWLLSPPILDWEQSIR